MVILIYYELKFRCDNEYSPEDLLSVEKKSCIELKSIALVCHTDLVDLNAEIVVNSIVIGMNLWFTPQSSEHCPYIIPGSVDSVVVELMRPGIASILILSDGIESNSKLKSGLKIGDVGSPSSVYRAFIDILAIDKSTPSVGLWVQENPSIHGVHNVTAIMMAKTTPILKTKEAFESLTPVSPPIVNSKRNPSTHNIAGVILMCVPYSVASHLKIFTPVGIPIIIVAAVNASETTPKAGSPPPEVSKKVVPKLRSVKSMVIPPARTGSEMISMNDVINTLQTNMLNRSNVWMMGRDKKHVVMKLILPAIDEIPARCREKITRSTLRGKDISVAPTMIGINQFPNPLSSMGITIKKIMIASLRIDSSGMDW
ncbi:hypothetical protein T12_902 [Trichinella patagoniensis]|uniref:Uncharacterized protein n=1 Tax=Trichinella patagoniensis TaxID=990121 RepID=A0A0V0Z651_9BILA|nr:hypothetical protein T12_902 [Trichinella patagoniensis]